MLFKAFQIKNYKSFVDSGFCSVQNGVTIFAGQNESGKSNILNALIKINDRVPKFTPDEYSFEKADSPEIDYFFELSDEEIDDIRARFPDIQIMKDICVFVRNEHRSVNCYVGRKGDKTKEEVANFESEVNQYVEQFLPKFILYQTLTDDIPDTFTVQSLNEIPIKRLEKYLGTDFADVFSSKNQQRQRNVTQRLSRTISDDFSSKYKQKNVRLDFSINGATMSIYIQDKKFGTDEYGYSFRLSQRSTGLRWYLNFYIALKGEELKAGDIILVDEPGMYLHPKAQQEMRGILNEESTENQIIYTTHSPYLIDVDNLHQIRLVEKIEYNSDAGYNEASVIREKIHHSRNIDTMKPIVDAIGYSLGSELNLTHQKVLICEGVSDYYYLKALELIHGKELGCGITHANGSSNIGSVASLFRGLGVSEIYVLVDSDDAGRKERRNFIKNGVFDETHIFTTREEETGSYAIEDIFKREWYLKEIFAYNHAEITNASASLSEEMKNKNGGAKYIWAKKLFELAQTGSLNKANVLDESGIKLFEKLLATIKGESDETNNTETN